MTTDKPLERKIQRRFIPFVVVGLLAPLTAAIPPRPEDWTLVWIALGATALISLVGLLTPWAQLPRWTYIVPPLAYFVVVAILREANDGSVSGYGSLALVPVVWIALNLGRVQVAIGIAVGALVFVLPLLVGDPESYTTGDWRRAVLWVATAAMVGYSIESLMREKRTHAREARVHEGTIAAIADATRALSAEADPREHICQATVQIAQATVAVIYEPDGLGELVMTATRDQTPVGRDFRSTAASPRAAPVRFRRASATSSRTRRATLRSRRTRSAALAQCRCCSSRSCAQACLSAC